MASPSVHRAIYSILSTDGAVNTLVGSHIYPRVIPESVSTGTDLIRYSIISNDPIDTKDGMNDLDFYRIQFDCYSVTGDGAQDIYRVLREALLGTPIGSIIEGITLDGFRLSDEQELYEDDVRLHRVIADFEVRVKRS